MASENRSIARYETTAVYTHPEAKVDIVLVHGLNGSPDKTWTAKNGVFWPLDLLPASLKDVQANIMVYGYNADVYSKRNDQSASDNFIHQHAQTLITNLTLYRRSEGTFQNPIIWVCHSLGGILVKRALLYSNDVRAAHHEHHRSIYVSTFGLVFLGTPHAGSDGAAWGLMLQAMSDAIIPKKFFESESVLLRTLKKENETLANINSHFLDIYQRFRIHMAHENHKTDLKGTKVIVVDANSASPQLPGVTYYGIEATHSGMCKFDSPSAPGYRNISTDIRQWILDAPAMIQVRWEVEEEERRARMRNEMSERMSPYGDSFASPPAGPSAGPSAGPYDPQAREYADQEPLTLLKDQTVSRPVRLDGPMAVVPRDADEPLFIHPDRFRPNSYFRGREQELYNLHRMLMDKHRRDQGTSAVLIWAVPGGGKSHLAREYAFRHRHDYPGGIFWIRGKTQEDLEEGFLKMAKSANIQEGIQVKDESDLRDLDEAIPLVRKWLNRTENWLLILDGVLRDTHVLSKYIPDARNTSMVLTSTDISIAGNHNFDSPQKIELGPLSEEDARIMLLEEMDKKKPWTQDDLSRALETVQLVECLPLAVHAAARQLRATREPLSKYIRAYKTRPRTGGLGAYKGVREKLQERGEIAALNLMYLLSFFNARVPVEMLALGLKALDKRTPVRTHDSMGKRSLNKTFTVLIAFALIERDEIEDVPSATTSSPSASLRDSASTELLDMLKIHSIVQTFFRETLKKESQFDFWLERAAAVFCKSFDEGDSRARKNPEMGLPDDYRRYAAHARKVLEHISRVDRPTPELRAAEKALQSRLGDIQGLVSTMSSTVTAAPWEHHSKDPHVSVFERTNSLSVPSSVTSTDSNNGEPVDIGLQGSWDQRSSLPTIEGNPHHYHIPYPQQSTIPVPELLHEREAGDWDVLSSHHKDMPELHRTLRRQAVKRYHDRAGAWRETKQKVNEPRVSISREVATGQFSAANSPSAQLATSSPVFGDAGKHLAHVKNANNRELGETGWNKSGVQEAVVRERRRQALEQLQQYSRHDANTQAKLKRNGSPPTSEPVKAQPRAQLHYPSQDTLVDEHPFSQGDSFGTASVPSIYHLDDGERRPRSRGATPRLFSQRHSDTCLETDVGQWAPSGLPVVVSSTSTLGPASHLYRPVHSHRQGRDSGYAGEAFSSSLPSSQGSTLQPPPWRPSSLNPDGYSSQPLSRITSSNHDPSIIDEHHSRTPGGSTLPSAVPIHTRRSPSMARTEPSPRTGAFENAPTTSYRAWQQRHSGPWSSEQVSPGSAPSPPTDGAEMVRSGSGGIQFNGRIVEFGQSPLAESAYPLKIADSNSLWWEDDEVSSSRKKPQGLGLGLVRESQKELQPLP